MTPFEVILVPFPFTDLSSAKQRPCLVLATYHPRSLPEHLVVAMITSQVKAPRFPHDVVLKNWKEAKLPLPSLVRLGKVVTVDASIVRKKLGELSKDDSLSVSATFNAIFRDLLKGVRR